MANVEPKTQTVKVRAVNLGAGHAWYGLSADLYRSIKDGETFDAWLEDAVAADADRPTTMTAKDERGVERTFSRRPGWMKRLASPPQTVAVSASKHSEILAENAKLKAQLDALKPSATGVPTPSVPPAPVASVSQPAKHGKK